MKLELLLKNYQCPVCENIFNQMSENVTFEDVGKSIVDYQDVACSCGSKIRVKVDVDVNIHVLSYPEENKLQPVSKNQVSLFAK